MTESSRILCRTVQPALREVLAALRAGGVSPKTVQELADRLASAVAVAQAELGDRARDPRIHRIIGVAASAAMALSLGAGIVPLTEVERQVEDSLREGAGVFCAPERDEPL